MWSDSLAVPFLAKCFFSVVLLNATRGNPHKNKVKHISSLPLPEGFLKFSLFFYSTLSFTYIDSKFWQIPWNMKSWPWLSLVAHTGRCLCHRASAISLLSCAVASSLMGLGHTGFSHFILRLSWHQAPRWESERGKSEKWSDVNSESSRRWRTEGKDRGLGFGSSWGWRRWMYQV